MVLADIGIDSIGFVSGSLGQDVTRFHQVDEWSPSSFYYFPSKAAMKWQELYKKDPFCISADRGWGGKNASRPKEHQRALSIENMKHSRKEASDRSASPCCHTDQDQSSSIVMKRPLSSLVEHGKGMVVIVQDGMAMESSSNRSSPIQRNNAMRAAM